MDAHELAIRNAALEVELRLVKERLAQAESATAFLVHTIGSSQAEQRVRLLECENTELRLLLSIARGDREVPGLVRAGTSSAPAAGLEHAASDVDEDLLSFDGDGDVKPGDRKDPQPASSPSVTSLPSNVSVHGQAIIGDADLGADGTAPEVAGPTIAVATAAPSHPATPPNHQQRRPTRFTDQEHYRLRASAFYIEELPQEEEEQYWRDLEAGNPRHTAAQWKAYFREDIRPMYLADVQRRARESARAMAAEAPSETGEQVRTHSSPVTGGGEGEQPASADVQQASAAAGERQVSTVEQHASTGEQHVGTDEHHVGTNEPALPPQIDEGTLGAGTPFQPPLSQSETPLPSIDETGSTLSSTRFASVRYTSADEIYGSIRSRYGRSRENPQSFEKLGRSSYPFSVDDLWGSPHTSEYRTVVITDLPPDATLLEVLSSVRGGPIERSFLLRTKGMLTRSSDASPLLPWPSDSAMVMFQTASAASAFCSAAARGLIEVHAAGSQTSRTVSVSLVRSRPTRPIPVSFRRDAHDIGLSRVLAVHNFPAHLSPAQLAEVTYHHAPSGAGYPLEVSPCADGGVQFTFKSLRDAHTGWLTVARAAPALGPAWRSFLPDPCAGPIEEVQKDDGEGCDNPDEIELDDE